MKTYEYNGFVAEVEWSEEDRVFVGKVVDIDDYLMFDGDTYDEAVEAFYDLIDDYLEMRKELWNQ